MTEPIKCSVCGKEYEPSEKWEAWLRNNPDKAKCPDCMKGNATGSTSQKSISRANSNSKKIDARALRKAYDEVAAEFADIMPSVKDFIGGWTTTIALSNSK